MLLRYLCTLTFANKNSFDFFQESGLSVDPSQKEPFVELNRILEALKVRVLRPALEWVTEFVFLWILCENSVRKELENTLKILRSFPLNHMWGRLQSNQGRIILFLLVKWIWGICNLRKWLTLISLISWSEFPWEKRVSCSQTSFITEGLLFRGSEFDIWTSIMCGVWCTWREQTLQSFTLITIIK